MQQLKSQPGGLSNIEAKNRLQQYGPNELQAAHRISPWEILLEQFKNVLILILLGATAISLFLGHGVESIVIAIIVLFAVVLGFVQEYRAERAIDALRKMAAPTATVLRDGSGSQNPSQELVPGDVIFLHTGDRVPADARLLARRFLCRFAHVSSADRKDGPSLRHGRDITLGKQRNSQRRPSLSSESPAAVTPRSHAGSGRHTAESRQTHDAQDRPATRTTVELQNGQPADVGLARAPRQRSSASA